MLQLLSLPRVEIATGDKRSTIYRDIKNLVFIPPVKKGKSARWPSDEVDAINRARVRGASDSEIRALVTSLVQKRKKA